MDKLRAYVFRTPSTLLEYATSHVFQDAYLAFARDPVNELATVNWGPYRHLGQPEVREFDFGVPAQDRNLHTQRACAVERCRTEALQSACSRNRMFPEQGPTDILYVRS